MPEVVNVRTAEPGTAIYIGRRNSRLGFKPSPFANPFRIGTRDEICDKYEAWIQMQPQLIARAQVELRGHNLMCYCAPKRCHGDTLLRIANEEADDA